MRAGIFTHAIRKGESAEGQEKSAWAVAPSRGENGAFESIVYYGSASFHSKLPVMKRKARKKRARVVLPRVSLPMRMPKKLRSQHSSTQ